MQMLLNLQLKEQKWLILLKTRSNLLRSRGDKPNWQRKEQIEYEKIEHEVTGK
jgi:hypothetical protein